MNPINRFGLCNQFNLERLYFTFLANVGKFKIEYFDIQLIKHV